MYKRRAYLKTEKMSSPMASVVDVYEIATDMGKSIEKIMELYGADAVTDIMPKVINVLELLETFATASEEDISQVDDLRCQVAQLELEKVGKAEDRIRYEKELEQIEDHYREDNRDLLELVTRLQDENKRLAGALKDSTGVSQETNINQDQDLVILQKMKEVIEKQRFQLRLKDKEKHENHQELETCQAHVEKLTQVNKELYRKQRNSQLQTRALIEEKAEMQAQLQDQQRELQNLKDKVGCANKRFNEDFLKMKSPTLPDLSKKVMYDADDPDRPRFTMNELRKILFERNDYKARVSELLDELELLKPKKIDTEAIVQEEEGPVQGPINRDPDDAPFNKQNKNSGIRKLFRILFGETSDSIKSTCQRSSPLFGRSSISQPRAMLH